MSHDGMVWCVYNVNILFIVQVMLLCHDAIYKMLHQLCIDARCFTELRHSHLGLFDL